ncbi:DUF6773 family protein [Anaerotignum sp.]|uniref:DUF6773 family protein n=1 Tax=Anaerotignum sp. TaxID=2039241 RepID=UPI00289B76C7|nr:DUF6773 family protein [Anaerotignum sp.]
MLAQRKFEDERLERVKNKISTEWFVLIYYLCFLSVIAKLFYFDMDFQQCITEFIFILLTPLYFYIRPRQLGIAFPEDKRLNKKLIISLILLVGTLLISAGLVGGKESVINWVATLLVYGFIAVALGGIVIPAEKKRKKKLEEKWSDD